MLTLPPAVRIYLAVEPVNMGKSFRGLSGFVRQQLRADPLSGHVFCFLNRRRKLMKLLWYDRTGYSIFYRRLSRGTFQLPPVPEGATRVRLDAGDLALIIEGIDLNSVTRRVRHHHRPRGLRDS